MVKRGRYREITVDSGAGESVVNPGDWPNVDLKPSTIRRFETVNDTWALEVKRLTTWQN